MTIEPKELFRKSQDAQAFNAALLPLANACQVVLLDMQLNLPAICDPTQATAVYNQMFGAKEFAERLLSLTEEPKAPTPIKSSALRN